VARVVTGDDLAGICAGWVGTLAHFQGMKSAMQYPLARGRATWQGEPVAAVVADSRALAEDGVGRLAVEWEPLPAVTDPETALDPSTPLIHPELGDNLAFALELKSGDPDAAFAGADHVYRETFWMGRLMAQPKLATERIGVESELAQTLAQLRKSQDFLGSLKEQGGVTELHVSIFAREEFRLEFSPASLAMLGRLGLTVAFEVKPHPGVPAEAVG
jgi:hypothetical protein